MISTALNSKNLFFKKKLFVLQKNLKYNIKILKKIANPCRS